MKDKSNSEVEIVEECKHHADFVKVITECQIHIAEQNTTLDFHSESFKKVIKLLEDHGKEISETNNIVTNGMQVKIENINSNVNTLAKDLQGFMFTTKEDIADINTFKWFRKAVNGLRDTFLCKILWFMLIVGAVISLTHLDLIAQYILK